MYVNCICFLNIIFFSFITTVKAEILSYDIQVEEKNIAQKLIRVHDETGKWVLVEKKETHNLIEDMNVYELSSHARFLALPHMVTTYNYYNNKDTNINWEQIIKEAAHKYQIDARLIWAVIRVESNFIATAISHKGAIGAMQIMPETQKELGLQNPINAKENVFAGTKYLKQLLITYGNNIELALAAYNAGAGNVKKYGGIPPYKETQNFVKRVLGFMEQ